MADNVSVNYEDERFGKVEADKQEALTNLEQTYGGMISSADKFYQDQIDASKQYAEKQRQLQQEQTDFAIEQIEQQKEQAKKDYTKEQSAAYVDWQKQSAKHGVEAEKMASAGLTGTGYSESSQVSMYNTYQNRVATARESFNRAVLNYDNAIKDARLQNNAKLAEIAYNALQQQLELSLQGFQYKNSLILEQASKKTELDQIHYQRYQDVLQQINAENAMAEEIRQYNESLAEEKRQYDASLALQQAELQLAKDEFAWQKSKYSGSGGGGGDDMEDTPQYAFVKGGTTSNGSQALTYIDKDGSTTYVNDGGTGISKYPSGFTYNGLNVNMKSVTDLGYGPINSSGLASLIAQGKVTLTKQGNQYYAKLSSSKKGTSSLLPGVR